MSVPRFFVRSRNVRLGKLFQIFPELYPLSLSLSLSCSLCLSRSLLRSTPLGFVRMENFSFFMVSKETYEVLCRNGTQIKSVDRSCAICRRSRRQCQSWPSFFLLSLDYKWKSRILCERAKLYLPGTAFPLETPFPFSFSFFSFYGFR